MKRFLFFLFLGSFAAFTLICSGTIDSQDGLQYLSVARNMYYLHKPTAPPLEYPQKNIYMNLTQGKNGEYYSPTGAGYSIALLPSVAISDVFHRLYHVPLPTHFPLESDAILLLFASFTNAFFAALLVITMYVYLKDLHVSHRVAMFGSFSTVIATNLSTLSKDSFAHMMFITFLVLCAFCVQRFGRLRNRKYLFYSGVAFGFVIISYNPVFIIAVPALALYAFLQFIEGKEKLHVLGLIQSLVIGVLGVIPASIFYLWYNRIRTGQTINSGYGVPDASAFLAPAKVLYEGVFGLLISPGRGLFIYTPLLLIPMILWQSIPWRTIKKEVIFIATLSVSYVYFYAAQHTSDGWLQWNGESSWGPRYVALLIPFVMLLTVYAFEYATKRVRLFVFGPLFFLSLLIQVLCVSIPYQVKFSGLQPQFELNGVRITTSDYANFLPRYSPLVTMPRVLARRYLRFFSTINHGLMNVRLVDGFDYPFEIGTSQVWRGMRKEATISLSIPKSKPLVSIHLDLANTQLMPTSTFSARTTVGVQGKTLGKATIDPEKWNSIDITLQQPLVGMQNINLYNEFIGTSSAQQVIFLRGLRLNNQPASIQTLDMPYVDPLLASMSHVSYGSWKIVGENNWNLWNFHSQVYEGTLDFWWIKALYYWDIPRWLTSLLFLICGYTVLYSYYQVSRKSLHK